MKSLVPYFLSIVVPAVLGAALLAVCDVMLFLGFGESALGSATLLGVANAVGVGLVVGTLLALAAAGVRRIAAGFGREADSVDEFLRGMLGLVVADGGWSRRALAATALAAVVAGALIALADTALGSVHVSVQVLVAIYAIWTTLAAIVPIVLLRIWAWRAPNWRPNAPLVWILLVADAVLVTARYWVGASPYTVWGAAPLMLMPAVAAMFCLLRTPGQLRVARIGSSALVVGAVAVVIGYPARSAGHAAMQSGPVFVSGCWQILAALSDLDGDLATGMLGGSDCAPLDYDVRPTAIEIVGNGVDDNCFGGELATIEERPIPSTPPVLMAPTKRPVIVITVDALRADAVGRRVDGREVTPAMDALSEGGSTFRNAYSAATSTDEAVPALWTGMYPGDFHQHSIYFGVERTLAEVLTDVGYQSIAVTLHPWLTPSLYYGFEVVDNSLASSFRKNMRQLTAAKSTELALRRVDERDPDRPLLLWVHYFDVHMPRFQINSLKPWLGADPYMHEVHMVDRAIGDLLTGLDQRGLLDDAVVVLLADHGEGLGEHNVLTHGWAVWESLVRIPLVLRLPGAGASTIDQRVSIIDVVPTLFDYLGIDEETVRDGRSLMPLVLGRPVEERPIFIETPVDSRPTHFAVIDGGLKFWVDLRREAYRLYDVDADPGERHNLIDERPDDAARLLQELGVWRDHVYNDRRLARKRDMWEARSKWEPQTMITEPGTIRIDETLK